MPPKSKPEEPDTDLHPVSLHIPKYILERIDDDAEKSLRSRSAQILFMLKDNLDLIENPS